MQNSLSRIGGYGNILIEDVRIAIDSIISYRKDVTGPMNFPSYGINFNCIGIDKPIRIEFSDEEDADKALERLDKLFFVEDLSVIDDVKQIHIKKGD